MIAENFNRNGYVANKHRQGDLWFETIGKHERVSHYETRKMSGVGYTSTYYGFIGGVDHLFADKSPYGCSRQLSERQCEISRSDYKY